MRASPAIDVMLTRFGVWRTAVALLAAAAVAAVWAWWSTWDTSPPHNVSIALLAALVTVSGVIVALAASLARVPCTALRWDGQGWQMWRVRRERAAVGEPVAGEVFIAIDLGVWMLLRFEPAVRGLGLRTVWLPVQRTGIEAQWHALRCALYSPRPAPNAEPAPP